MPDPIDRRTALKAIAASLGLAGAGWVSLPGCGVYPAEDGPAFDPWKFPGGEGVAERVVARAALLAASPHNTQPWALAIAPTVIELRARLDRNLGAMDSLRREMHLGLGCAIENMVVAARGVGRAPDVTLFPAPGDPALVARIALSPAAVDRSPSFDAIASRHTNRGAYADGAVVPGLEDALRALVDDAGVGLHYVAAPQDRARFRAETIAATEAIAADRQMSEDGERWLRYSADEIAQYRDGVILDATGSGAATRTFGKMISRPSRETADEYWIDATRAEQTTGSAFVLLSSPRESTREQQLRVGRVFQRLALWAATQGLAMQPLNQLAERQDREESQALEPRFGRVLEGFVGADRRAQMLFRVGYPWDRALASPRRPLEWVIA